MLHTSQTSPLVSGGRALKIILYYIIISGKFELSFVLLLLWISNLFEFVKEKRLEIETLRKTQSTVIVAVVAGDQGCLTVVVISLLRIFIIFSPKRKSTEDHSKTTM